MDMWIEAIGIAAGVIVLASFLLKGEMKIRFVNIFGAILFVVYGVLIKSIANILLNGGLVFVHIYYMIKYKKGNK